MQAKLLDNKRCNDPYHSYNYNKRESENTLLCCWGSRRGLGHLSRLSTAIATSLSHTSYINRSQQRNIIMRYRNAFTGSVSQPMHSDLTFLHFAPSASSHRE
jgi:hypothetical protein